MKSLYNTSPESLDTKVAEAVRLKIQRAATAAEMETEIAATRKRYAGRISVLDESIAAVEEDVRDYCVANRAALFPEAKSRDSLTAVFGFELTPPRVETSNRKITWRNVIERLLRLPWGAAYVRQPEPQVDKKALLTDRANFSAEQLTAAGITFEQDEIFFIRPKSEVAQPTTQEA